jgi:hypothetical protein
MKTALHMSKNESSKNLQLVLVQEEYIDPQNQKAKV